LHGDRGGGIIGRNDVGSEGCGGGELGISTGELGAGDRYHDVRLCAGGAVTGVKGERTGNVIRWRGSRRYDVIDGACDGGSRCRQVPRERYPEGGREAESGHAKSGWYPRLTKELAHRIPRF